MALGMTPRAALHAGFILLWMAAKAAAKREYVRLELHG